MAFGCRPVACFCPLVGFFAAEKSASGKRPLVFKREGSFSGLPVRVPCGQCIGCRLERARVWAIRCMHEKRVSVFSEFVTLTYDDDNLPDNGSLVRLDMQLFMKRLRKEFSHEFPRIRFFGCGEYGGHTRRPHYHLILFNVLFADKRYLKLAKRGEKLYFSARLEKVWPYGNNVIGDVSFDTCSYVARYVCDKLTGPKADIYEKLGIEPEFSMCSLKPGIGSGWFDNFNKECYDHDSVIMNEREVRPPRYYDLKYEGIDAKRIAVLKRKRRSMARRNASEQTPERRRVREQVILVNLARATRDPK